MPQSNCYSMNPWNSILGDCSIIDQCLLDKPILSLKWFITHFLNVFLRAIGQVVFVNNPLSGLLILIATFLPDWKVGMGMVLGGSIATIGEMVLRLQPWELMRNGVGALNGVLVGSVISSLVPNVYNVEMDLKMWIFICLGAITSILVCSAFVNTLGAVLNIPYLTLPFNLIVVCSFLTIQPQGNDQQENTTEDSFNSTAEMPINWYQVGRGIAVSMGQVYAINNVLASSIMNLAVFLASPLLFIMSTIGAIVGSLAGVLILPNENLQEVYDGIWGYNAVISTASISCVFFVCSPMSFTFGMINLLATIGAQYALRATLVLQLNIPVLTMPFAIPTIVMIYVTDKCKFLNRVHDMTYPEKQAYEWHTGTKAKLNENQGQNSRILVLLLLLAHFLKSPKTPTTVNV